MPYTLDDYYREYTIPFVESLPPEIRLRGLKPDEVFKSFSPEERLKGLPPEVIEEYLSKIKSSH